MPAPAQPNDHVVTLLPQLDEFRYQFGRILQIAIDLDGSVAGCLPIRGEQRTLEAIISVEADDLDPIVRLGQSREPVERRIFTVVVCENEFEIVARQRLEETC